MNSQARVWLNLSISLIMGVASLLVTQTQSGGGLPRDTEGWVSLALMVILNVAGNLRAWLTNTPEQARAVQALRDEGLVGPNVTVSKGDPSVALVEK